VPIGVASCARLAPPIRCPRTARALPAAAPHLVSALRNVRLLQLVFVRSLHLLHVPFLRANPGAIGGSSLGRPGSTPVCYATAVG
jgi:hypothetical protein